MQFWLFLFGAVACVALSGAAPVGEVKVISEEPLDGHHEIHKRQLEIVNVASGLICDHGIAFLEDKLENLNIPSFSTGGVKVSSVDVRTVDIGGCDISFRGGLTNPSVRITLSNIRIQITGRYKKKVLFFRFKGSWTLDIRNGHLDVDATLQFDLSTGKITRITVNSCSDDFTDVRVRFHGSLSAIIINLFRGSISRRLGRTVEDKVCEVGVPFLENEVVGGRPTPATTRPRPPTWRPIPGRPNSLAAV